MIEVKRMDVEALKDEMKEAKILKTTKPSVIKKKYENKYSSKCQREIEKNEFLQMMYSPSKVLPVKVGNLIINYKLYSSFMKKLRNFESKLTITDDSLRLEYWKFGSKSKGTLYLNDLAIYFDGFRNIPDGQILENV